jgi:hypothetical protein
MFAVKFGTSMTGVQQEKHCAHFTQSIELKEMDMFLSHLARPTSHLLVTFLGVI